jgi:hypothetical protein
MHKYHYPLTLLSMVQTLFIYEAYGTINLAGSIISLFLTLIYYYTSKEIFSICNCLLGVIYFLIATKSTTLSNSPILLFAVNLILIYYYFSKKNPNQLSDVFLLLSSSVYFVSALHKINKGFFLSEASCATGFLNITSLIPHQTFLASSIVTLELIMGVFILIPSLRKVSIYLIFIFHSMASLALPIVEQFGLLILVLISFSFSNIKLINKFSKNTFTGFLFLFLLFFISCSLQLKLTLEIARPGVLIFSTFFMMHLIGGINNINTNSIQLNRSTYLTPLLYFMFCLSAPYIGIRETGVLNMYSNLIPSSQNTNHYFLGNIFPYLINPWRYHIKIYEIQHKDLVLFKGNYIIKPDDFTHFIRELLIKNNLPNAYQDISIKSKIAGIAINGNFHETKAQINNFNTFNNRILSRVIVPNSEEKIIQNVHKCSW